MVKKIPIAKVRSVSHCPYCYGADIVKSGFRIKKYERAQLFYCNHCHKKFTPLITKGKTYPISLILNSLILYNKFIEPNEVAEWIKERYGLKLPLLLSITGFKSMRD